MAICKNVGFDHDGLSDDALNREFAAINFGLYILNDDAASTFQLGCNYVFCLLLAFCCHEKNITLEKIVLHNRDADFADAVLVTTISIADGNLLQVGAQSLAIESMHVGKVDALID